MIQLNEDQENAVKKIKQFLSGKLDIPYFTLTGAGGTGKTLSLKYALENHSSITGATIAHSAKNVLSKSFENSINCYTVAQWLGLKMVYSNNGDINFISDFKSVQRLKYYKIAVLDEASMVNDNLYNKIMSIVNANNIKLIVVGDIYQLPPVKQEHDSKFFDSITAELKMQMRFSGHIETISNIYRDAIKDINLGYIGNKNILNEKTSRKDRYDYVTSTGFKFKNNIHEIIELVADDINSGVDDINHSRVLAYKNDTIKLLNEHIRKKIYGNNIEQFTIGELVISVGGFYHDNVQKVTNGQIYKISDIKETIGPYDIPCYAVTLSDHSIQYQEFKDLNNVIVPVVRSTKPALDKYNSILEKLRKYALRDPKQWRYFYKFKDSFAYFDYAYAVNTYKAQGQTISNVYVLEGEIMNIKPISLKHKLQSMYVAVTRASKNLYIYNKNY